MAQSVPETLARCKAAPDSRSCANQIWSKFGGRKAPAIASNTPICRLIRPWPSFRTRRHPTLK
jgi:hypothetical protein